MMQIVFDPDDNLDIQQYGIELPISYNNSHKTVHDLMINNMVSAADEDLRPVLLPWYHNQLSRPPSEAELSRIHDPGYISRLFSSRETLEAELRKTFELEDEDGNYNRYDPDQAEKPLEELFETMLRRGGGVIKAAELALEQGEAWYFGGGFHHAHWDYGSGFCIYSDTLAARERIANGGRPPRTLIIDIDAHKGDGTADLVKRLYEKGDDGVIALSIHMARGWPMDEMRKVPGYNSDPAWIESDIDVPVESGEESEYNKKLTQALEAMGDMAYSRWNDEKIELAFVLAGADPFEEDQLPSTALLNLNRKQMLERNLIVRSFLSKNMIPAAWVQAGNYGDNSWKTYNDFLFPLIY